MSSPESTEQFGEIKKIQFEEFRHVEFEPVQSEPGTLSIWQGFRDSDTGAKHVGRIGYDEKTGWKAEPSLNAGNVTVFKEMQGEDVYEKILKVVQEKFPNGLIS